MKKYLILTAEVDENNEDEFRFAAIKGNDDSLVYNFENCVFKEVEDNVEFVANVILLERKYEELLRLSKEDPRTNDLLAEADEILKQFVDDLYAKMNSEVEHLTDESAPSN